MSLPYFSCLYLFCCISTYNPAYSQHIDINILLLLVFRLFNPLNAEISSAIPSNMALNKVVNFLIATLVLCKSHMDIYGLAKVKVYDCLLSSPLDSYNVDAFLMWHLIGIRVAYPRPSVDKLFADFVSHLFKNNGPDYYLTITVNLFSYTLHIQTFTFPRNIYAWTNTFREISNNKGCCVDRIIFQPDK